MAKDYKERLDSKPRTDEKKETRKENTTTKKRLSFQLLQPSFKSSNARQAKPPQVKQVT
jgi:hypothetical protein